MSIPKSSDIDVEKMKSRLCSIFHCGRRTMSSSSSESKRKLVLHFDVNKTIVPVDTATGETVEAALNVFLSGLAWGKDLHGEWQSKEHLSSAPLEVDDVSFYKFVEKRLLPNVTRDRSAFRFHLMSFTDCPQGSNFKPYLNELLRSLKWTLPYDVKKHEVMTVPGTKSCRYHFIIPAFYTLLRHLVEEGREFAVIFRTYGNDVQSVLKSIRSAINHAMPFCDTLESLAEDIGDDIYSLKRDQSNSKMFTMHRKRNERTGVCDNDNESCHVLSDNEMYTWFTEVNGIVGIKDNVEDWYQNNFDSSKGKPLWVDHNDPNVHHIFFDDNIRPGSHDSILNLRLRDKSSGNEFRVVDKADEYLFKDVNLVPVNFTEAILDENYFVEKMCLCEENYSKRLDSV